MNIFTKRSALYSFLLFLVSLLTVIVLGQYSAQSVHAQGISPAISFPLTPTVYCLGSCPTVAPSIVSGGGTVATPSVSLIPTVSGTPCPTVGAVSVQSWHHHHHRHHGFIQGGTNQLLQLLIQLLELIFKLLGINMPPIGTGPTPSGTVPSGNPCVTPSATIT